MQISASRWDREVRHRLAKILLPSLATLVAASALAALLWVGCSQRHAAALPETQKSDLHHQALEQASVVVAQVPTTTPHSELVPTAPRAPFAGSRLVLVDAATSEVVSVLTKGLHSAGEPDCSFDGERILFVGSQNGDEPAAVWEIGVDGAGLRRVTGCPGGCADAIYLSTIYTIDAAAPEDQIAFVTKSTRDTPAAIYTCRLDGTDVHPVTFAPTGASHPALLRDGRLVFSMAAASEEGTGATQDAENTAIFSINTDGTDVFPFAGLHERAARRSSPCEAGPDSVVFAECDGGSCELVCVSRTLSLQTRRVVRSVPNEIVVALSPMANGRVLLAHGPSISRTTHPIRLSIIDVDTGEIVASVLNDPQWHAMDAAWVAPRPKPPGRSSVVDHTGGIAQLYCLNAYISGTSIRDNDNRSIERIRVFTPSGQQADTTKRRLLGEADVSSDGSFFLELPARTPLQLASVDERGEVLREMRSVFWVMPSERRGCIGCHEDRALTPPNRHVYALRKPPQRIGLSPKRAQEHSTTTREGMDVPE